MDTSGRQEGRVLIGGGMIDTRPRHQKISDRRLLLLHCQRRFAVIDSQFGQSHCQIDRTLDLMRADQCAQQAFAHGGDAGHVGNLTP